MSAGAFDTLSAARELEAAGVERSQAEAIAKAIRDGQGELVTKADLAALEARIDKRLAEQIGDLKVQIAPVKWAAYTAAAGIVALLARSFGLL